jgi:hypothetical protein
MWNSRVVAVLAKPTCFVAFLAVRLVEFLRLILIHGEVPDEIVEVVDHDTAPRIFVMMGPTSVPDLLLDDLRSGLRLRRNLNRSRRRRCFGCVPLA